jgi:hypothetical protein
MLPFYFKRPRSATGATQIIGEFPDIMVSLLPIDLTYPANECDSMKTTLLFCATVLAVAGCASDDQTKYSGYSNLGFSYDYVPQPVKGLTPSDSVPFYGPSPVSTSKAYGENNYFQSTQGTEK